MKIVFTGGGTGGHFTPIIAIAQKVNQIIDRENIVGVKLYYISNDPYDQEALFENGLKYEEVMAGKMRTYFSIKNLTDIFKVFFGVLKATFKLFSIYPDVVFAKGGYASFPTLFAARILRIPVVIHESDSKPGRVNMWASKFAKKIAISFPEAAEYFPKDRVAWTGQPVRKEIEHPSEREKGLEYFNFESGLPTIFILGGSQGAEAINHAMLDALPRLLQKYQVIHQTGVRNFKMVKGRSEVMLADNKYKARYMPMDYLNTLEMKNAAGIADLVVSRAGSTIFEIASWGVPSIIIPFSKEKMGANAVHAKKNAFAYARSGACSVVEEENMTSNILVAEVERIMGEEGVHESMSASAKEFYKQGAAMKIAEAVVQIALSHEK